ncbi:unnamed protein product, partial [Iphiclides podalirius]
MATALSVFGDSPVTCRGDSPVPSAAAALPQSQVNQRDPKKSRKLVRFKHHFGKTLRDRFALGLGPGSEHAKLFEKNPSTPKLTRAIELDE